MRLKDLNKMAYNKKSSSMIWSRRSTLKLIGSLKSKPVLWLPGHKNYLNSSMRIQAHRDIALELHKLKIVATIGDIRKKIHTLRSQYSRQVKEILEKQSRYGKVEQPALWSFDELSFLWPICAPDTDMPIFEEPDDFDLVDNLYEYNEERTAIKTEDDEIEEYEAIEPQQVSNKPKISRKIQWTRNLTKKLIELYEKSEVLWKPKHNSLDNLQMRKAAVKEIAKEMSLFLPGITTFDIQEKLRMLRFQYQKQVHLLEIKKKEGIEILPKLWCFNLLSFLWSFHAGQGNDNAIQHGDDDDDDDGVDYDNELEDSGEMKTFMDDNITESMCSIEALQESDADESKEVSIVELDEYDSDELSILNSDDSESVSNCKSSQDTNRTISSSKGRYKWIGTQVVDTLNELENEDVIFDTVVSIENLLQRIREVDKEQKTKSQICNKRLPQRRSNRLRPKLSDFNNFEVSFNLNQLHVKDVSVKVIGQTIVIEGDIEVGCDQDRKKFIRNYDLPSGYDVDSVEATKHRNGLLKVKALKLLRNTKDEIELPIKHVDKSNLFHNTNTN